MTLLLLILSAQQAPHHHALTLVLQSDQRWVELYSMQGDEGFLYYCPSSPCLLEVPGGDWWIDTFDLSLGLVGTSDAELDMAPGGNSTVVLHPL